MAESAAYAEQSLLKAAVAPSHRLVLYRLGFQLGIALWQDAWRRSIFPPPSPPPTPTPTPAALVSSPAGATQTAPSLNSLHPVLDQLLADVHSALPNGSSQLQFDGSIDLLSPMQTDATAADTEAAPDAAASSGQDAQQCMAIIEAIRREEFGIGVELDAASSLLRHRQNERIGRALQRLSQELYSKDTHFVLELVQNADDNSYAPGVLPALEFILQDTGITVLNNEVILALVYIVLMIVIETDHCNDSDSAYNATSSCYDHARNHGNTSYLCLLLKMGNTNMGQCMLYW